MSEPTIKEVEFTKTKEDLETLLQSPEDTKFTGVFELTKDLLPSTQSEFQELIINLIGRGIIRVPILSFDDGKIFCLFTNKIKQNHFELFTELKDLGYKEKNIDFTTSIELGGSGRYLLTFKNGSDNPLENKLKVTFGRGSDTFDPQLTEKGINRIEEIFNGEIKQI